MGLQRWTLPPMFALALSAPLEAQVVRGLVLDEETRRPVVGAGVELSSERGPGAWRESTDSMGVFMIAAPRGGEYRIRVSHPGYLPYEGAPLDVGTGETLSLEIRLGVSAIPLDPLVVTARSGSAMAGFDERRRAGGFGRYLTRVEIEARAPARTTDLLRGMAGLTLVPARRGFRSSIIEMRSGLGRCRPAIWVDGSLVEQFPGGTVDDFVPPETLEGVEVYTSSAAAPLEYVTGPCGVILFWTRRGSSEGGEPWSWKKLLLGVGAALGLYFIFVH